MILAGDIGGTNVRLALFEIEGGRLAARDERKFRSREVSGLERPVEEFLAGRRVSAAGFGVAGPVRNGRSEATNLSWIVDAAALARQLSLPRVALVNDLFANAAGLGELSPSDFAVVNAGTENPDGNAALISAGTGLGEAFLVRLNGRFWPQASEGGHASFAPRNAVEIDLLRTSRQSGATFPSSESCRAPALRRFTPSRGPARARASPAGSPRKLPARAIPRPP